MWKYSLIPAVALLLGASFFFCKNNDALTAQNGEVAAFQSQFSAAVQKSREIESDQAIKKYAELRTEYFRAQAEEFKSKADAAAAETAAVEQDCTGITAQIEAIKAASKLASESFNKFRDGALAAVEMESSDIADEDDFRVAVIAKLAEANTANQETESQISAKQAQISAIQGEIKTTLDQIAAAKKLSSDRMARLSPPELSCTVLTADPNWDFVILDAGIDKGIISGSRLAAHRDGKKICELSVTLVEGNRASCEVVYSTMRPGDRVQVGDKVTAVRDNK